MAGRAAARRSSRAAARPATGAVAIARLGGSVELWSYVGDDYHGKMIKSELERQGVDVSQIHVASNHRSPSSYIEVDSETGERTIYGSGFDRRPADVATYFDPSRASSAKSLLVTEFVPSVALEAAKRVHAAGGMVVADLFRVTGAVSELVHHVDALILPEFTVESLAGSDDVPRALSVLADLGSTMPAITVGPKGCYYMSEGTVYHCPAFSIRAGRHDRLRRLVPRRLLLRDGPGLGAARGDSLLLGRLGGKGDEAWRPLGPADARGRDAVHGGAARPGAGAQPRRGAGVAKTSSRASRRAGACPPPHAGLHLSPRSILCHSERSEESVPRFVTGYGFLAAARNDGGASLTADPHVRVSTALAAPRGRRRRPDARFSWRGLRGLALRQVAGTPPPYGLQLARPRSLRAAP